VTRAWLERDSDVVTRVSIMTTPTHPPASHTALRRTGHAGLQPRGHAPIISRSRTANLEITHRESRDHVSTGFVPRRAASRAPAGALPISPIRRATHIASRYTLPILPINDWASYCPSYCPSTTHSLHAHAAHAARRTALRRSTHLPASRGSWTDAARPAAQEPAGPRRPRPMTPHMGPQMPSVFMAIPERERERCIHGDTPWRYPMVYSWRYPGFTRCTRELHGPIPEMELHGPIPEMELQRVCVRPTE
jgi:hypothetical protein